MNDLLHMFNCSVLSKYGSGLIMRDPAEVQLIVHACAYLHNLSIDEGLVPITRLTQRDPDMEELLQQNALVFLLNSVKRNEHRVVRSHYRPQARSVYEKGLIKRNQILREQFGERSLALGRLRPKRGRGRPRGSMDSAPRARRAPAATATRTTTPRGRGGGGRRTSRTAVATTRTQ